MQPELQELERYVHDALGATVKTAPWRGAGNLPPVLRERYKFAQAELLGLHALLVIDSNPEEQPPATVRKHMDMLQARQQADLIYVRAQVTVSSLAVAHLEQASPRTEDNEPVQGLVVVAAKT